MLNLLNRINFMLIDPPSIDINKSLKDAALSLNKTGKGIVIVTEDNKFSGIVTDGDLRRGLLNGLSLESRICKIVNRKCITILKEISDKAAIKKMLSNHIEHLPLLNCEGVCKGIYIKDEIMFGEKYTNVSVLLMAGGFGKRLMPLTKDIPKPMLPVNGVPLLEKIIEDLRQNGLTNIFISVFYKKEIIKNYFQNGDEFGVSIKYVEEKEPLGTAGCLYYLKKENINNLLVLNADIFADINYKKLIENHISSKAKATICAVVHQYKFPFGVIDKLSNGGIKINEKPTITKLANAGIYVLTKEVCSKITYGFRDMTDLISSYKPVNIFTLFEKWTDIGILSSYQSVQIDKKEF